MSDRESEDPEETVSNLKDRLAEISGRVVSHDLLKREGEFLEKRARRLANGDAEGAAELAGEARVRALKGFRTRFSLRGDVAGDFRRWLSTIINNLARDGARRRKCVPSVECLDDEALSTYEPADPHVDIEGQVVYDQTREAARKWVREALAQGISDLSTQQRAIMHLTLEGELEPREIAQLLDTSANSVGVASSRARDRLRKHLQAQMDADPEFRKAVEELLSGGPNQ